MTSDDEFFFDYLSWVPNDVWRYSTQVASSIDHHIDQAASQLRDTFSRQSWIPSSIRPLPNARHPDPYLAPPKSLIDRAHDWVLLNRAWAAAILAFVGTGGLLMYGNRKLSVKKRKARRAGNGARKEIVVIAGSVHDAVTRSIACDLERRGFIVYITVTSTEEDHLVQNEAREDIRSLWLDLANTPSEPSELHPSLHAIHSLITKPQAPMPGVPPHTCQLTGLILVPSLRYPSGPVATIPASSWADTINTRLLYPILTAQLFLPLLTMKSNSSIVLITPSIQSSLSSPFASPEVAVTRALSGFAASLRQELHTLETGHGSVEIIELKLGNLDYERHFRNTNHRHKGTEVLTWQPQQRALYGSPYLSSIESRLGKSAATNSSTRGSPVKELHFAVFDALAPRPKNIFGQRKKKKQVLYVGRGSRAYAIVGNVLPPFMISWMLGLRTGHAIFFSDSHSDDGNGYGSDTSWTKVA